MRKANAQSSSSSGRSYLWAEPVAVRNVTLISLYTLQLFNAPNTPNRELKEVREVQAVARSGRLRTMCRFIPESGFRMRKEYYANKVRSMKSQAVGALPAQTWRTFHYGRLQPGPSPSQALPGHVKLHACRAHTALVAAEAHACSA